MKGPRICALRIQNGSSNILLDNTLEGETEMPAPVIYTRRMRLVDEELDDGREVTLAYDHKSSKSGCSEVLQRNSTTNISPQVQQKELLNSKVLPNQADGYRNVVAGVSSVSCAAKTHNRTSSTSVSSELDLRRQQLSRVAEWVQNNSKITDLENNLSASDNDAECISLSDSQKFQINAFSQNVHLICNRPSSGQQTQGQPPSSSSSSHHQLQQNNNQANMLHKSLLPALKPGPGLDFAHNSHKNSINLYKYFELYAAHQEDEEDEDDLLENENENCNFDYCDDENDEYGEEGSDKNMDDENQIDLAQMEYNVKQFLLKQSEWSIHNKISALSGSSSGAGDLTKTIPQRTETNL